jgi:hypothetical protein
MLAGCGTVGLFGTYEAPESEDVAAAPWPRLVDVPEAPPPGTHGPAVPDPAEGRRILEELGLRADLAGAEAARLSAPLLSEAERARLAAASEARRTRR